MAFAYYKSMTLDESQAGTVDSTDYPLTVCPAGVVQSTDGDFRTVGNGGYVQNSNGYDIRPYADLALTTALDFELVTYNGSTGAFEMHVKVPTLSTSTNTVIYMAFGDASISTDGSTTSAWNAAFIGVWHMKDGTTLSGNGSTSSPRNFTFTNNPTATAGEIDGAANFVRASAQLGVNNGFSNLLTGITTYTMSVWYKSNSTTGFQHIAGPRNGDTNDAFYMVGLTGSTSVEMRFRNSAGTAYTHTVLNGTASGTFKFLTLVYTGSNLVAYVNGTQTNTLAATGSFGASNTPFNVGGRNTNYCDGAIDELRFSVATRSPSWITADYNSQKASSTFITWGALTPVGGAANVSNFFFRFK